jgi:hypothetical protein
MTETYTKKDLDDSFIAGQRTMTPHEGGSPSETTLKKFEDVNKSLLDLTSKIDKIYFCMFGIAEDKQAGLLFMVNEIREQTKKTNGRVNKLENWQSGVIAITLLLSTLVPACAAWFFYKLTSLNEDVIAHVASDTKNFNEMK